MYPTACSQARLDSALSVRPRSAELLCADVHVKEITFNKGYYTVDVTYFYRVRGETFPGCEPAQQEQNKYSFFVWNGNFLFSTLLI